MAMIVLTGQNNVGKSTLCDWICERWPFQRFHHAPKPGLEAEYLVREIDRWGLSEDIAVFDRFYWTYLAYPSTGNWGWGKAMPPSVTPAVQEYVEAGLREAEARGRLLLIHAAIPIERLWAYEIGVNPAVEEAKDDFLTLKRAFEDVLTGWKTIPYDYTDPESVQAVKARIEKFVVKCRAPSEGRTSNA